MLNPNPKAQPQNHPKGVRLAAFKKGQVWNAPGYVLMDGKARAVTCYGSVCNNITKESAVRFHDARQGYFDVGTGEALEDFTLEIDGAKA